MRTLELAHAPTEGERKQIDDDYRQAARSERPLPLAAAIWLESRILGHEFDPRDDLTRQASRLTDDYAAGDPHAAYVRYVGALAGAAAEDDAAAAKQETWRDIEKRLADAYGQTIPPELEIDARRQAAAEMLYRAANVLCLHGAGDDDGAAIFDSPFASPDDAGRALAVLRRAAKLWPGTESQFKRFRILVALATFWQPHSDAKLVDDFLTAHAAASDAKSDERLLEAVGRDDALRLLYAEFANRAPADPAAAIALSWRLLDLFKAHTAQPRQLVAQAPSCMSMCCARRRLWQASCPPPTAAGSCRHGTNSILAKPPFSNATDSSSLKGGRRGSRRSTLF